MGRKPETNFKIRVIKELKTLPNTWFVKIQQRSTRGIPDFLLSIKGFFVALELKSSQKSPLHPLQDWTLKEIAGKGGLAFVSHPENWKETFLVLKELATRGDDEELAENPGIIS